jgi:hypothetical protein
VDVITIYSRTFGGVLAFEGARRTTCPWTRQRGRADLFGLAPGGATRCSTNRSNMGFILCHAEKPGAQADRVDGVRNPWQQTPSLGRDVSNSTAEPRRGPPVDLWLFHVHAQPEALPTRM